VAATVIEHSGHVAGERRMHVADVAVLDLFDRERHAVGSLEGVAKLAVAGIIPGHVVAEDLEEALHIAGLVQDNFKRQLLFEFVQLLCLQLHPHVRVAIIRRGRTTVNQTYVQRQLRTKLLCCFGVNH